MLYGVPTSWTTAYEDIAKMIDHSLLPPTMTVAELEAGIQLALAYDVASVCIMPYYVPRCVELLNSSSVKSEHGDWLSTRRARFCNQAR